MRFRSVVPVLLALVSSAAHAHDFWLQPTAWEASDGAHIEFTLQVGHGRDRQRSPIKASRVIRIQAVQPDGTLVDLRSQLHLGDPVSDLTADGSTETPAMVVLATDVAAESHLDADRFNAHLRDEGLSASITWRAAHGQSGAEGSENYGRVAKALIASPRPASVAQNPLGLELEIVPLADVYAPGIERIPVRVVLKGAPLQGATAKLYDLAHDSAPAARCLTDSVGRCEFGFARRGSWLVNVVWSTPNAPGSGTDFRTIFSSLTFGFDSPATD